MRVLAVLLELIFFSAPALSAHSFCDRVFTSTDIHQAQLDYTESNLKETLDLFKNAWFITDSHNAPIVQAGERKSRTLVVQDIDQRHIKSWANRVSKKRPIVGVGGCSALDMARAVAASSSGALILVPTILSTACISVDKSVLLIKGQAQAMVTRAPDRVIIPLGEILSSDPEQIARWTASGLGDIFGRVSALIDVFSQSQAFSTQRLYSESADIEKLFQWVENDFNRYDRQTVIKTAELSHIASLRTMQYRAVGKAHYSIGSEHRFYYWIMNHAAELQNSVTASHGEIVALGTLLNARLIGQTTGDLALFQRTLAAFSKLGLPVTWRAWGHLGVNRSTIETVLKGMRGDESLLGQAPESVIGLALDSVLK